LFFCPLIQIKIQEWYLATVKRFTPCHTEKIHRTEKFVNFNKISKYKMCVLWERVCKMEDPLYISEELLKGKVYRKERGLLSIPINPID
jgi:hypothetical protein